MEGNAEAHLFTAPHSTQTVHQAHTGTAVFDSLVKRAKGESPKHSSARDTLCPLLPHTDLSTMQTLLLPATAVAAGSSSTSRLHRRPIPAFHIHIPSFSFPLPNLPSSSKTFQPLSFPSPSYGATHHRRPTLSFAVRASQVSSPTFASPDGEAEKAKLAQVLTLSFFLSDFSFQP
jgi:hypothetical protein